VVPKPLWLEEYVKAIHATKVGLCFLSKWNRNTTAMRSFEIPACRVFLLAERTGEHEQSYIEGREAEFFGSTSELVDKLRHYIGTDVERQTIAQGGYERCLRSDYSYTGRISQEWRHVEELLDVASQGVLGVNQSA